MSFATLPPDPALPGRILVVGAAVLDRIFYVSHLPAVGETAIGSRVEVLPGGKGANQAVAAARMGAEVRLVSGVGRDEAAELVLTPLRDMGVNLEGVQQIEGERTAEALIAVDEQGENQIVACPGAYYHLTPERLEAAREAFEQADWLLVQNELPAPTVHRAVELGLEHGLRIIYNPAPFRAGDPPPPRGLELLVPNEVEAAGLLGGRDYIAMPPHERADMWHRYDARHILVTLGRRGGEWYDEKRRQREFDRHPVTPVDTVGAGDAFCGVLAALLAQGEELEGAIRAAHVAAALSVTKRGAQAGLPTREELIAALESRGR